MKIYKGEVRIIDYECPSRYTVIISEDRDKVDLETKKVADILNSIPRLDVGNRILLREIVPPSLKEIIDYVAESRSTMNSEQVVYVDIDEYELGINNFDHLLNYSEELKKQCSRISRLSEDEAIGEFDSIINLIEKTNEIINN